MSFLANKNVEKTLIIANAGKPITKKYKASAEFVTLKLSKAP